MLIDLVGLEITPSVHYKHFQLAHSYNTILFYSMTNGYNK